MGRWSHEGPYLSRTRQGCVGKLVFLRILVITPAFWATGVSSCEERSSSTGSNRQHPEPARRFVAAGPRHFRADEQSVPWDRRHSASGPLSPPPAVPSVWWKGVPLAPGRRPSRPKEQPSHASLFDPSHACRPGAAGKSHPLATPPAHRVDRRRSRDLRVGRQLLPQAAGPGNRHARPRRT